MSDYLNEDQRQLVDALARYLEREHPLPESGIWPEDVAHRAEASAHWSAFVNFGLTALTVDENHGGIADDPLAVHAAMELFGRHLVTEPFVASIVQGTWLLAATSDTSIKADALLRRVLAGEARIALAHAEPQTDYTLHHIESRAERIGDGWMLSGHKVDVAYAVQAERWLVLARTSGARLSQHGLSLFVVDPGTPGIRHRDYVNLDGSTGSEIWFEQVQLPSTSLIGEVHQAWLLFRQACARANAALCAEAVGAMLAVLDTTVAYAKERKQFGASIGSFQAIQHRLVDMYMQLEKCRSLAQRASGLLAQKYDVEALAAVSAAKALCCQSARNLCQSAIQLHGGIGMTDELALGKFVKRLMVISHTLGDELHHVQQFAKFTPPTQAAPAATAFLSH
ncbi:hypothetical protein G7047_08340 [Diaphorobacter sp. HDW4A]|uniref:acyl-CoA dehydrogenase family protein n=1 Tax=Diaphorobacter sp. HDW4A TaxID=2714924 RepID=UPI00140B85E7|nr:acyl-CoA dehydrogenase [Diaphorobacter sp. HDW4A]QIL79915.1 hypothetical protein G7047_08340 [Diaphorobacter sp. HDW4A]